MADGKAGNRLAAVPDSANGPRKCHSAHLQGFYCTSKSQRTVPACYDWGGGGGRFQATTNLWGLATGLPISLPWKQSTNTALGARARTLPLPCLPHCSGGWLTLSLGSQVCVCVTKRLAQFLSQPHFAILPPAPYPPPLSTSMAESLAEHRQVRHRVPGKGGGMGRRLTTAQCQVPRKCNPP